MKQPMEINKRKKWKKTKLRDKIFWSQKETKKYRKKLREETNARLKRIYKAALGFLSRLIPFMGKRALVVSTSREDDSSDSTRAGVKGHPLKAGGATGARGSP